MSAFNDLKVIAWDIQNEYLAATFQDNIWTLAGPDFGSNQGNVVLVVRALYGMNPSGSAFRSLLDETLHDLGYRT